MHDRTIILVAGGGVSGEAVIRLLLATGTDSRSIVLIDDSSDNREACRTTYALGGARNTRDALSLLSSAQCIYVSPGWRPDNPLLCAALDDGLPVIGDIDYAYCVDQAGVIGPSHTWLGITGTNGKTTTTAMVASMMSEHYALAGRDCRALAVGNIGVPAAGAIVDMQHEEVGCLVAELSSFQLHWAHDVHLAAGCLLNLGEDHVDWHGSFEAYARDKAKILRSDVVLYPADDPLVCRLIAALPEGYISGRRVGFTLEEPRKGQIGVVDDCIIDRAFSREERVIASLAGISPPGVAGRVDALAAAAVALSQGANPRALARAVKNFHVAKHRGEVVLEHNGVVYVDNSKATNPHAADGALSGVDAIVWVAGGQLKGAHLQELIAEHAPRMKAALLLGADRAAFATALRAAAPEMIIRVTEETDPERAMDQIGQWAVDIAAPGDTVVLAPAAASLDMYTGMGQRGDLFTASVRRHAQGREDTLRREEEH